MQIPKWLPWAIAILSFLGFLDAAYLTVVHYLGIPIKCSILAGCQTVTTSKYSMLFGTPIALYGSIYYLIIFILSVAYFDSKKEELLRAVAYISPIGFIASLVFVFLQLFVIKAICEYCVGSAITSTLLFILGVAIFYKYDRIKT